MSTIWLMLNNWTIKLLRGEVPRGFEGYVELLLSACSTYDKNHDTPRQAGPHKVYAAALESDDEAYYDAHQTKL